MEEVYATVCPHKLVDGPVTAAGTCGSGEVRFLTRVALLVAGVHPLEAVTVTFPLCQVFENNAVMALVPAPD